MKEQTIDMIDHTLNFSDMITWNEENVRILQLLHGRSKSTENNLVARPRQLLNQLNGEFQTFISSHINNQLCCTFFYDGGAVSDDN